MALLHQLALSCIPGIGSVLARNLLSYCGDAEEVFKAKAKHLAHIPGIGPKTLEFLKEHSALKRAEKELEFIDKFTYFTSTSESFRMWKQSISGITNFTQYTRRFMV